MVVRFHFYVILFSSLVSTWFQTLTRFRLQINFSTTLLSVSIILSDNRSCCSTAPSLCWKKLSCWILPSLDDRFFPHKRLVNTWHGLQTYLFPFIDRTEESIRPDLPWTAQAALNEFWRNLVIKIKRTQTEVSKKLLERKRTKWKIVRYRWGWQAVLSRSTVALVKYLGLLSTKFVGKVCFGSRSQATWHLERLPGLNNSPETRRWTMKKVGGACWMLQLIESETTGWSARQRRSRGCLIVWIGEMPSIEYLIVDEVELVWSMSSVIVKMSTLLKVMKQKAKSWVGVESVKKGKSNQCVEPKWNYGNMRCLSGIISSGFRALIDMYSHQYMSTVCFLKSCVV